MHELMEQMKELDQLRDQMMMMMCFRCDFVRAVRNRVDDVFQFDLFLAFALPANILGLLKLDEQKEKPRCHSRLSVSANLRYATALRAA